jgi:hypothetical protein
VSCEATERESAKRVVLALIDRIIDTLSSADPGDAAGSE